jgi:hypothetical protein
MLSTSFFVRVFQLARAFEVLDKTSLAIQMRTQEEKAENRFWNGWVKLIRAKNSPDSKSRVLIEYLI